MNDIKYMNNSSLPQAREAAWGGGAGADGMGSRDRAVRDGAGLDEVERARQA